MAFAASLWYIERLNRFLVQEQWITVFRVEWDPIGWGNEDSCRRMLRFDQLFNKPNCLLFQSGKIASETMIKVQKSDEGNSFFLRVQIWSIFCDYFVHVLHYEHKVLKETALIVIPYEGAVLFIMNCCQNASQKDRIYPINA